MKISFTMTPHGGKPPIHSTRFDFEKGDAADFEKLVGPKFNPSFYVPRPFAEKARRVRVTIEEIP